MMLASFLPLHASSCPLPCCLCSQVHIRNLVQSLELAAAGLTAGRRHVASGQAYFISDDAPVDNFEFFRPLLEGLGYRFPRLCLPFWLVLLAAWLMELAHAALRAVGLTWHPILVRQEVFKSGVTHYFSVAKARRELGYDPVAYDFGEVVEWMRQRGHAAAAAAAAGAQQQERSAAEASAAAGSAQAAGAKIGGKGGRRSRRTSSVVVAANQQQQRWSPLTNITVGAAMRAAMLGWAAFQGLMVATQGEGRAAATAAGAACVVLSLLSHHASARLQRLVAVALALALGGVALAAVATAGPGLMRRSTAY